MELWEFSLLPIHPVFFLFREGSMISIKLFSVLMKLEYSQCNFCLTLLNYSLYSFIMRTYCF